MNKIFPISQNINIKKIKYMKLSQWAKNNSLSYQ